MVNISVPPLMFTCICCAIMPRYTNTVANYGRIAQSLICIMYILVAYGRACAWRCSCRGCENPLRAHAATCPQGYILNAFQHIPTVIAQPPAFSIPHEEDDRREMKHARVRTYVLNWTMRVAAYRGTEAIRQQCLHTLMLMHQRTMTYMSRVTIGDHSRWYCPMSSYEW